MLHFKYKVPLSEPEIEFNKLACRWLPLNIYLAASRLGKYPPLATYTSVNSC